MRINAVIESKNDMYRNLNSKYKNKHEDNNKNDVSFYDILEKAISYRIKEKG